MLYLIIGDTPILRIVPIIIKGGDTILTAIIMDNDGIIPHTVIITRSTSKDLKKSPNK